MNIHPVALSIESRAINGDLLPSSAIRHLLALGRPANVAGFIVTIVVNSIQRMFRTWLRSDVGYERLKTNKPFRPHPDSASTVVDVGFAPVIVASVLGLGPRFVLWSLSALGRMAVKKCLSPGLVQFPIKTPTRCRVALSETSPTNNRCLPAVALTLPTSLTVATLLCQFNYKEPTEALA